MTDGRLFPLRILKAGWGIAIDLTAKATMTTNPPDDATLAGTRTWLKIGVKLPEKDVAYLAAGLRGVSSRIEAREKGHHITIEVTAIEYVPTDYQPEGMAAAIIGWASEEFALGDPEINVEYDPRSKRYVFNY